MALRQGRGLASGLDQRFQALPNVPAGKMRAYAVTARTRPASAPEVPAVDEAGLPGFYMSVRNALRVPRGTPREIVMRLNGAVVGALADLAIRKWLEDLGLEIPPREKQTPEALRAFHEAEIERWVLIVKAANVKLE
jgi:tripartite-type tricarboxylate transporter receptor subunit TctC